MTMTTIKVTSDTRDRLKAQALHTEQTLGEYLASLADKAERDARFTAMRSAYASMSAEDLESYWQETRNWLDADLGT